MVEFDTLENASKARDSLHGCDIYNNCCTMRVDYSKLETLKCRENGPMSWDFARERSGDNMRDEDKSDQEKATKNAFSKHIAE